ncbi:putative leucine-rich repeat domain superfamily [Helianthus anomalus]
MFDGNLPNCLNRLSYLETLDISLNQFTGTLPPSLIANLTSLKMFDISSNQFTGILLPSLIVNLKSLEYVDFGLNKFEGSFSFSSLSNHTKLEFFQLERDNEKLELETEEPIGWIPMFQLKVLALPNCNIKRLKGSVVPSFLLHQHKLIALDMSHNSLEGQFPNWLLKNNTKLKSLKLRNNSLQGVMHMEYLNANMRFLDMSGNHITDIIHHDIQKFIPYVEYLNFSSNALNGVIPSSICDLHQLGTLDLSQNKFSGRLPNGLLTNLSHLEILKLSKNALHGQILSGNLSLGGFSVLHLDNNYFTGNIGNKIVEHTNGLLSLDISDNYFRGTIPSWISNASTIVELVMRNNRFEGQFPCGKASFRYLDISQNFFSGPIPYCLILEQMQFLYLSYNRFTGLVPNTFSNLTNVLTLDIGHNNLSGRIPEFLGNLSSLRILLLGANKFNGSIPEELCKLTNVSLIDLSSNSLSGLIPRCLHYNTGPKELVYIEVWLLQFAGPSLYVHESAILQRSVYRQHLDQLDAQDEAQFTTKRYAQTYKGKILDYMTGLDLSCNELTGEIPPELGMLTRIFYLNLSHNKLTGPIPVNLSNLKEIESLDLSFNGLTGKVPSELIQLKFLAVFNVSYNNLYGKLPEWKAQFATFTQESYKGNPLLCGPPLENNCITKSQVTHPSNEEGTDEKWYSMDMASFYGSSCSTWLVFMLGFAALLYINPYWRRRWLQLVEECMFTCYFFLNSLVMKPFMIFYK